jgi:excinuclease ABC subunit A
VLGEVESRLEFLQRVDLGYLTLDRLARTLSGGEAQRIELANALGANLTDTLYVLDEPTIGLHARDSDRLATLLGNLTARGNTLVVVEHEPILMRPPITWSISDPARARTAARCCTPDPPGRRSTP